MTKRILIGLCALAFVAVFFWKKEGPAPIVNQKVTASPKVVIKTAENFTTVPVATSVQAARVPASTGYVNQPSDDWEERLIDSFKDQAGPDLKEIKIVKERTVIWKRDDNALHANAIMVTLTTQQDVQTSFRALVDSQTGKVLESWDRSISDPANVRQGFRFKLDPRYSN